MHIVAAILSIIGALIVGLIVGFFVSRKVFKRYLEKNPPINRQMIKNMFAQMGRTASEKQINQVMASMKQEK